MNLTQLRYSKKLQINTLTKVMKKYQYPGNNILKEKTIFDQLKLDLKLNAGSISCRFGDNDVYNSDSDSGEPTFQASINQILRGDKVNKIIFTNKTFKKEVNFKY